MNYDLAKKLKEAGFPQRDTPDEQLYCDGEGGYVYAPTLSELIAACEESYRFTLLRDAAQNWMAIWDKKGVGDYGSDICKSAEEAVASLYLELNKKSK